MMQDARPPACGQRLVAPAQAPLGCRCKAPVVLHLQAGIRRAGCGSRPSGWTNPFAIQRHVDAVVVLDEAWKDVLEPMTGPAKLCPTRSIRCIGRPKGRKESERLLVMGRDAAVKRRDFALDVLASVRHQRPSVHLHLTGGQPLEGDGWTRHGWLSEAERLALLHNSSAVLLPSRFEDNRSLPSKHSPAASVIADAISSVARNRGSTNRSHGGSMDDGGAWTLSAPADTATCRRQWPSMRSSTSLRVGRRYAMAFERRAA